MVKTFLPRGHILCWPKKIKKRGNIEWRETVFHNLFKKKQQHMHVHHKQNSIDSMFQKLANWMFFACDLVLYMLSQWNSMWSRKTRIIDYLIHKFLWDRSVPHTTCTSKFQRKWHTVRKTQTEPRCHVLIKTTNTMDKPWKIDNPALIYINLKGKVSFLERILENRSRIEVVEQCKKGLRIYKGDGSLINLEREIESWRAIKVRTARIWMH